MDVILYFCLCKAFVLTIFLFGPETTLKDTIQMLQIYIQEIYTLKPHYTTSHYNANFRHHQVCILNGMEPYNIWQPSLPSFRLLSKTFSINLVRNTLSYATNIPKLTHTDLYNLFHLFIMPSDAGIGMGDRTSGKGSVRFEWWVRNTLSPLSQKIGKTIWKQTALPFWYPCVKKKFCTLFIEIPHGLDRHLKSTPEEEKWSHLSLTSEEKWGFCFFSLKWPFKF